MKWQTLFVNLPLFYSLFTHSFLRSREKCFTYLLIHLPMWYIFVTEIYEDNVIDF